MPLAEGQVSVRSLVMGKGTAYKMLEFNPHVRNVRADQGDKRAWGHGTWSGVEWTDEVVVPMRIRVLGTDAATWFDLDQDLKEAFAPIGQEVQDVELRWMLGGREFVMFGRPRMVDPDVPMLGTGQTYTKAAFVALTPAIFDGIETVVSGIGLPTFTGGVTVPLTVPFTVTGVAVGGFANLTNGGKKDTGLILRIDGPVVEPSVTLVRADGSFQRLTFDLELLVGQWLDVDTKNRVVLLNGTSSRRGEVSGNWPILPPGTHTLRWSARQFNPDAVMSVRFRSAWR